MNQTTIVVLTQLPPADVAQATLPAGRPFTTFRLPTAAIPGTATSPDSSSWLTVIWWNAPGETAALPVTTLDSASSIVEQVLTHLTLDAPQFEVLPNLPHDRAAMNPWHRPAPLALPAAVEPPQLRLRVLGQTEVAWQGTVVRLPKHGIEALTLLVLSGSAGCTIDELRERLYGDSEDRKAGSRKLLERLRRLMPGLIVRDGLRYRLSVRREQLDADVLVVRDTPLSGADRERLELATAYAAATLLPGNQAAWVHGEREALQRRGVELWLALAEQARQQGDDEQAVRAYQAARELGPLQERVVAATMQLDLELGRPVQAITTFLEYRQLLDETLGLNPPPLIEQLYRQALNA